MKTLKYIVYKEDKYYVSQCLNIDVSSFGNSFQEAIDNLNEALLLYFDEPGVEMDLPLFLSGAVIQSTEKEKEQL